MRPTIDVNAPEPDTLRYTAIQGDSGQWIYIVRDALGRVFMFGYHRREQRIPA
jgi:hypothetical protein